jgi:hypothetical protein
MYQSDWEESSEEEEAAPKAVCIIHGSIVLLVMIHLGCSCPAEEKGNTEGKACGKRSREGEES